MSNSIALLSNYSYVRQLETTIKSVLIHNVNVHFYVLNSDIPQDWFELINQKIASIGSRITDKKIDPESLSQEHVSQSHVAPITYARFFIPQLIQDDVVLYLDSDIIVDGDLSPLLDFHFDDDEWAAAAKEVENDLVFNAGVIVLNNKRLRRIDNLTDTLLKMGNNNKLTNGDQSVFNDYFDGHIKELSSKYNYEIGMDRWAFYQGRSDMVEKLATVNDPVIIHYANDDKPWNTMSSGRMRSLWWKYNLLGWDEIVNHAALLHIPFKHIESVKIDGKLFTITNNQNLEHLEELVQKLPNWQFEIGAYTYVGWNLAKMQQYPNVKIHPVILKFTSESLFEKSDAYLDINFGRKEVDLISQYQQTGRPVISFESAKTAGICGDHYHIFGDDQIDQMVEYINSLKK